MPIKPDREYRSFTEFKAVEENDGFFVRGYASTFEPYLMYHDNDTGIDYFERVLPEAFNGVDLSDAIFQYDHQGRVLARSRNNTLRLWVDEHGLAVEADLSLSDAARGIYDDIKNGLVYQMSFAFSVAEEEYDRDTHTRIIRRFRKIYDVSAVSIPANPGTEISARSYYAGVAEQEAQELRRRADQIKRIRILTSL